jgi:hypothetical protein
MPDWLKQYEEFFGDTGAFLVEVLMNTYGAKAANRLAQGDGDDVLMLRALMINAQVHLLTGLKGAGLLMDLSKGSGRTFPT